MTSKRIAQTNQQQDSEKPQASSILQRAAVRSVSDAGVQSTQDIEAQPLGNSAFSKDFSRVPSTTKLQMQGRVKPTIQIKGMSINNDENLEPEADVIGTKALQMKQTLMGEPELTHVLQQNTIQAKLTIGEPRDKYELEADAIASQVMSMSAVQPEMGTPEQTHSQVRSKPLAAAITPLVQHKTMPQSARGLQGSGDFESRLSRTKGGGSPLPHKVRAFMEPRFGANLSDVRVHTNSEAVQMNHALGALAFTHGKNIYYGAGKSPGNDHLTAHELTHKLQQSESAVQQYNGNNTIQRDVTSGVIERSQPAAKMPTSTRSVTENLQPLGAKETAGLDVIQCVRFSKALPGNLKFSTTSSFIKRSPGETEQDQEETEHRPEETKQVQEEQAKTKLSEILNKAAQNTHLEPKLLANDKNVEKLVKFLRIPTRSINQEEYEKYQEWAENVYDRISEGAAHLVQSINHWRTQLLEENASIDKCEVNKVELAGSDLHERGLGVVFVEFTKPPGGQIAGYSKDTTINVVIKPEDRNIEKSLLGSEPTSLANQINQLAELKKERLIETIKMETSKEYGTMVEFIKGEMSEDAGKKPGKNVNSLTEAIAFVLLAGLSDINKENVIWKDGKPYLIDADNALNAFKLNKAEKQSAFELYDSNKTDAMLKDWTNNTAIQKSMIQKALLENGKAVEMIAAVKQAYVGKTGRVVPLFTNTWAQHLAVYFKLEEGNQDKEDLNKGTRWKMAKQLAKALENGANTGERGLKGEAGIGTNTVYEQSVEASLIKQDLDRGQIPFYKYEYNTGHVIHNGQVIYGGQSIDDAEKILKKKFNFTLSQA